MVTVPSQERATHNASETLTAHHVDCQDDSESGVCFLFRVCARGALICALPLCVVGQTAHRKKLEMLQQREAAKVRVARLVAMLTQKYVKQFGTK